MWTNENRGRYDRSGLRYPSALTEEEWGIISGSVANFCASRLSTDVAKLMKRNGYVS